MRYFKKNKSKRIRRRKYGSGKDTDKLIEQEFEAIEKIRKLQENPSHHIANTIIHLLNTPNLDINKPDKTTTRALLRLINEAEQINQAAAIKELMEKVVEEAIKDSRHNLGAKEFTQHAPSNVVRPKARRSRKK